MPNTTDPEHVLIMSTLKQNEISLQRLERKIDVGQTEVLDQIDKFRDDVTELKINAAVTENKMSNRTVIGSAISMFVAGIGIALATIFGK